MNRRSYLALVGGVTSGSVTLSGCVGDSENPKPFDAEKITATTGRIPTHNEEIIAETKAENGAISSDFASADATGLETDLNVEMTSSGFFDRERNPREGMVTSNSTVIREIYWQAPKDGEYELLLDYEVSGTYNGTYDTCLSPSMILLSSAYLDLLQGPEMKVAGKSIDYVSHGEMDEGPLETLLEFMVGVYVNKAIKKILGDNIISKAIDVVSLAGDIITGCRTNFEGRISRQDRLKIVFCADKNDTFKIQSSFVAGITIDNGGFLSPLGNHSEGEIDLSYNINNIEINRLGRNRLGCWLEG